MKSDVVRKKCFEFNAYCRVLVLIFIATKYASWKSFLGNANTKYLPLGLLFWLLARHVKCIAFRLGRESGNFTFRLNEGLTS